MKRLKSFNKKKKGLMALESLVGIILSVIGLFFVVSTLFNFFLNDPTNLEIAKGNAQSIVEFINFAAEQNYDKYDCFYYQQLERLENFQVYTENNKENYFYVIDNSKVYIFSFKDYSKLLQTKNIDSLRSVEEFEFERQINLMKDETDQGKHKIEIDFEIFNLATIGGFSTNQIKLSNSNFIVLFPYLSNFKAKGITNFLEFSSDEVGQRMSSWIDSKQNQNVLIPQFFVNGNLEESPSFTLAMNKDKELFIPLGQYSDLLVKKNLCTFYQLRDKDEVSYYTPKKADGTIDNNLADKRLLNTLNKKIIYRVNNLPSGSLNNFIWYGKDNYICQVEDKNAQCPIELSGAADIVEFRDKIWKYYSSNPDIEGEISLSLKVVELKASEIADLGETGLDFNHYFEILDYDISSFNDEEKKRNGVYDITKAFNDDINGVSESYSNLIQLKNAKIYSYYKTESGKNLYYSLSPDILNSGLRKRIENGNVAIYFNNNKLSDKQEYDADKFGIEEGWFGWLSSSLGGDNEKVILLKLPFLDKGSGEKKVYDIFLSGGQYSSIKEFENE